MKQIKNVKILLFSILICALVVGAVFLGRHLYLNHLSNQPVMLSSIEYKGLKEISAEDLISYLKTITFLYEDKTIEEFSDDDIAIVVAYSLLIRHNGIASVITEEQVKEYVEMLFGISDYDLKPGTYMLRHDGHDREIKITKDGDIYSSNVEEYDSDSMRNKYASKTIAGKEIIVTYNYGYHGDYYPGNNKREIVGKNKIYLESNGKRIFVKKIVYTPVK